MDWPLLGTHTIATITSFFAIVFLTYDQNFKPEIQSIADSISQGNFDKASRIWKDITDSEMIHKNSSYLIEELISHIFNQSHSADDNLLENLSKFIHISISSHNKASSYAKAFESAKQNGHIYNNSGVFALTKYVFEDKVQRVKFEVDNDQKDKDKSITDLLHIIPSSPWPIVLGQNVILRNDKYRSYLYLSGDESKQMLAWNRKQLVNKRQAEFQFRPEMDDLDRLQFAWLHPLWNFTMNLSIAKDQMDNPEISNIYGDKRQNDSSEGNWKIELVENNLLRIIVVEPFRKGILYVREPKYDLDAVRSQVGVSFEKKSRDTLGRESYWTVIQG